MRPLQRIRVGLIGGVVMAAVLGTSSVPAQAEPSDSAAYGSNVIDQSRCGTTPSMGQVFGGTVDGFRHLRSRDSLTVLAIGAVAAASSHPADRDVTEDFAHTGSLRSVFKSGSIVGGTPLQLSSAFAVYGIGRALHHPCAAAVGADLIKAQLMAEALTIGIKESGRRSRPAGNGFSFPSGHTAAAFASATVLQRHFGWKVGIPAYGVAAYVAASRVQTERHYLSDVAFGAAVGIVAGRSVTFGSQRFVISPTASRHGAGVSLSWAGRTN
jgi:membrane-associated phospholipid phosphatase